MKSSQDRDGGYTLMETIVASAVVAAILISIVTGGASLQKIYAGSDGSLKATADQSRILDYIVRDVRQALTVTVSNAGQTLTLTVPNYVDQATGQARIPRVLPGPPTSSGLPTGVVDYGDPAAPLTVTYFPANAPTPPSATYVYASNGSFLIRQQGNTQTVISLDCTSLQISLTDQGSSVLTSISFSPRFNFRDLTNARIGTTVFATSTLRNVRRN